MGMNANVHASVSQVAATKTKTKTPVPDEPTAEPTDEAIDDDTFPETIDPTGKNPKLIVTRLQADGLVPKGGKQLLLIPESFGTSSDPGFGYLRMGRGTAIQNMVFQFEMGWSQVSVGGGCGMGFRIVDNKLDNYWYVVALDDGTITLTHIENEEKTVTFTKPTDNYLPKKYNYIDIIALDDTVALYVNGAREIVKKTTGVVDTGVFSIIISNDELATKKAATDCRYQNIWAWSFD